MNTPVYDAAWMRFSRLTDTMVPREARQFLEDMQVPDDVVQECLKRHERETTRIAELKEPVKTGRENALQWYTGPHAGDKNWFAYRDRLAKSLDKAAVEKIDEASDVVVSMLDHPATPEFRSRGLVVGHVQSGKTANFTAVISKAADRGYRMFIVLSGVHNSLRRQTQTRLIRDVVEINAPLWHQITKAEHDFQPPENPASLLSSQGQTLLLVVKKNAPVLRKLRTWLRGAKGLLGNCPALIIDDEADQATVATKRINPLITDIIDCFPKVCYVGYTATPFANLLIDPANEKDFYPKDFVLSLPRGVGYQGAEELFGRPPMDGEEPDQVPGGLDMIRGIPDEELPSLRPATRAETADFEPEITPTLRRACLWFWLATGVRRARGHDDAHSSMLIHAHSDTRVHDSFRAPLQALRDEVVGGIESESLLNELRELFAAEIDRVPRAAGVAAVAFETVHSLLPEVVAGTRIVMDHYRSTDRLDYTGAPSTVIAVGGNTLSRGLTLEGLIVSVFVRSADAYDTLLQMGRWFGYRTGYEDLPRVYMPKKMTQWFTHLATVEAELRREVDRYLVEHKTPRDLAVRIRSHPKMKVVATAKQGSMVKASASYGGQLVESRYFPTNPADDALRWLKRNERAVGALLREAATSGRADEGVAPGRALWRHVPVEAIQTFLDDYRFHERSIDISADLMAAYISRRVAKGGLANWNVGVVGSSGKSTKPAVELPGSTVNLVSRTRLLSSVNDPVADIKTLTGSRDSALDLEVPTGPVSRAQLDRLRIEQHPETGLVLLYPIDAKSTATRPDRRDLEAPGDIVWGAAFVFPLPTKGADLAVEYDYVSADLSKVYPAAQEDDETDATVLDENLDADHADD